MRTTATTTAQPNAVSIEPLPGQIAKPIQESILALLIWDKGQDGAWFARVLPPEVYDGDYEEIARKCIAYWERYSRAPRGQIDELFADVFTERTGRDLTYGQLFVHLLEAYQSGINPQFLRDKVDAFRRTQQLKAMTQNIAQAVMARGEAALDDCEAALEQYRREARDATPNGLVGLADFSGWRDPERSAEFTFGVPALDALHIRPQRRTTSVALAGFKGGKSFALQGAAVANALHRRRVLLVSCELSAEQVQKRIWQRLLTGARHAGDTHEVLLFEGEGQDTTIVRKPIKPEFALDDPNVHTRIKDLRMWERAGRTYRRFGWIENNISIVHFAPGTATAADIEAHVMDCKPDMVIVDYLEEMRFSGKQEMRHQLRQHMRDLARLAHRYDIAVITAQQINRQGMKGGNPDALDVSEDVGIARVADTELTIRPVCEGLVRIKVSAARSERQGQEVAVTQNLAMGNFCVDSRVVDADVSRAIEAFAQPAKEAKRQRRDQGGRNRTARNDSIRELADGGMGVREIARALNLDPSTVSRVLGR